MEEMFGLGAAGAGEAVSARLTTHIPLPLHLIDLGGGLKYGLTTCHEVTAEHLESIPMKALWRGLSHPGIKWSGGLGVAVRDILTLMTRGMMQLPGELPGGESYAILSREYVNLSAKFGYHYATLDAFVGEKPEDIFFLAQPGQWRIPERWLHKERFPEKSAPRLASFPSSHVEVGFLARDSSVPPRPESQWH